MLSITGEAGSLWQALTAVPDHRRKAGKRPHFCTSPMAPAACNGHQHAVL
jgi:hypothetical protein